MDSGRSAFLGLGFIERESAFDFVVALQDFSRRLDAVKNLSIAEPKDFSLKEGQTIVLSLGKRNANSASKPETRPNTIAQSKKEMVIPLIPPPPQSKRL